MNTTYTSGFRSLIAWQEAHRLTLSIYKLTVAFPPDERYGIVTQMQRAASSIAAQIAEGSRMPTNAHRKIYYDRAYASAAEVDYFLELAKDLGYLTKEDYENHLNQINRTSYLLHKLITSIQK